jgi:hypothetical protein
VPTSWWRFIWPITPLSASLSNVCSPGDKVAGSTAPHPVITQKHGFLGAILKLALVCPLLHSGIRWLGLAICRRSFSIGQSGEFYRYI